MECSNSIGKLAIALSRLQGEIRDVFKDQQGYGYKYANLASVLEIARPLCAKYELSVSQLCEGYFAQEAGYSVGVQTVLMHSSGEYISSKMYMPVERGKGMSLAQAAGSVITYARRYALAAILGITQTDNDGIAEEAPVVNKPQAQLPNELDLLYKKIVQESKVRGLTREFFQPYLDAHKVAKLSELNEDGLRTILNDLDK